MANPEPKQSPITIPTAPDIGAVLERPEPDVGADLAPPPDIVEAEVVDVPPAPEASCSFVEVERAHIVTDGGKVLAFDLAERVAGLWATVHYTNAKGHAYAAERRFYPWHAIARVDVLATTNLDAEPF